MGSAFALAARPSPTPNGRRVKAVLAELIPDNPGVPRDKGGLMYRSAMLVLVPLFALCLLLMLPAAAQPASVPPPIVTPPFPDKLHVSIHCMLDYRDVVTMYG